MKRLKVGDVVRTTHLGPPHKGRISVIENGKARLTDFVVAFGYGAGDRIPGNAWRKSDWHARQGWTFELNTLTPDTF